MIKRFLLSKTAQVAYFKGMAACGQIALNVVIARSLGLELTGVFFVFLSVIMLSAIVSRLGLDNSIVKYVSAEYAAKNYGVLSSIYARCSLVVALVSLLLIAIFSLNTTIFQTLFFDVELEFHIFLTAFSVILFLALSTINAEFIRALGYPQYRPFFIAFLPYCVTVLVLFVISFFTDVSLQFSLWSFLSSCLLSYFLSCLFIFKIWPKRAAKSDSSSILSRMISSSKSFYLISVMNGFFIWGLIPVAAYLLSEADAGGVAIALRMANMVSFVLNVMVIRIGPQVAVLYAEGKYGELSAFVNKVTKAVTIVAIAICLPLMFFSTQVLSLFGEQFISYSHVFVIFIVGQLITCIVGPATVVLTMTGKEKVLRDSVFVSIASTIVLLFVLVPIYGVIGAAVAIVVGVVLRSLIASYVARKHIRSKLLGVG